MCDYSLHAVETRPAKVGDKLRSTTFANCFTRGFAALGEPNVAVCLRPGTELAFDRDVEIDHGFGRLLPSLGFGRIPQRLARFRQLNMDRLDTHHDALEFPDGRLVLVTRILFLVLDDTVRGFRRRFEILGRNPSRCADRMAYLLQQSSGCRLS